MTNNSSVARKDHRKQRTQVNALRQEFTGQTIILPSDQVSAYNEFCAKFHRDFQPRTSVERQLVHTIADGYWRLNRIRAVETTYLTLGTIEMEKETATEDDRAASACAAALTFIKDEKTFRSLCVSEERLTRACERAQAKLKREQAERSAHRQQDLDRAAELKAHHDEQQTKYAHPSDYDASLDGFAFSNVEIDEHATRKLRYQRARDSAQQRNKAMTA